jgi:anti-sigma regulatory factor (Ser/Thr protein kinase)
MEGIVETRLAPTARAPAQARRAVERLAGRLRPHEHQALQLLVSELVTNSVRHAELHPKQAIELEIRVRPDAVRVTVTDPGRGFVPPTAPPSPDQPTGWGLFLVQRVADRWGVRRDGQNEVWFELARAGLSA